MIRQFASPAAFKASLEERLRVRARESGLDLQRLRQLVVYDRLLARVFGVVGADVVLKGGLALELRSARARATKDVDLRMMGDPDAALARLQAAGQVDLGDHLRFAVAADAQHPTIEADGLTYEGRRYRVQAELAGRPYGRPFGVDIAFAEPLVADPEPLTGAAWLAFLGLPPTELRVYPWGAHVAEKLHAFTLPRPRPNSRVKDLPDIALLAETRSARAAELRAALVLTFAHRGTHALPTAVPDPPAFWSAPYAALARDNGLPWATVDQLMGAVRAFLDPVLAGEAGRWDPQAWAWRADG